MRKTLPLNPGDRYGRLTVLEGRRLGNTPGRVRAGFRLGALGALCRCDCGREIATTVAALASGNTRSCGCLRTEIASARIPQLAEHNRTHGLAGAGERHHPLYSTWYGMMQRCYQPRHKFYQDYGGRGIVVCERWHDPALFVADIERSLGPKPHGMTLDRICNDHDYRLDNVQWASRSAQMHNRRPLPCKLSSEQVSQMRQLRKTGLTLAVLAAQFDVSVPTAHRYTKDIPVTPRRGLRRR